MKWLTDQIPALNDQKKNKLSHFSRPLRQLQTSCSSSSQTGSAQRSPAAALQPEPVQRFHWGGKAAACAQQTSTCVTINYNSPDLWFKPLIKSFSDCSHQRAAKLTTTPIQLLRELMADRCFPVYFKQREQQFNVFTKEPGSQSHSKQCT